MESTAEMDSQGLTRKLHFTTSRGIRHRRNVKRTYIKGRKRSRGERGFDSDWDAGRSHEGSRKTKHLRLQPGLADQSMRKRNRTSISKSLDKQCRTQNTEQRSITNQRHTVTAGWDCVGPTRNVTLLCYNKDEG
jgi:hypothetical protein